MGAGGRRAPAGPTSGRLHGSAAAAGAGSLAVVLLRGLYPPLVTPFAADGSVDLAALERLAAELIDGGAAGLVAVNLPVSSPAQTPSAAASPTPSPTPAAPSPLAEAYAEVARVRFGKHLEDSQWDRVKRDLEGNVRTAERLRSFKLQNSDEPDFVFAA